MYQAAVSAESKRVVGTPSRIRSRAAERKVFAASRRCSISRCGTKDFSHATANMSSSSRQSWPSRGAVQSGSRVFISCPQPSIYLMSNGGLCPVDMGSGAALESVLLSEHDDSLPRRRQGSLFCIPLVDAQP